MNKRILFIGAVNLNRAPKGGEEYKNQVLHHYLNEKEEVVVFDTHQWKKRPLMVIKMLLTLIIGKYSTVLISASSYSTYRLLNFTSRFNYIQKKVIYAVVGGYFPEGVRTGKYKASAYTNLKKIIVEGRQMKKDLADCGLSNVAVLPNFKDFPINLPDSLPISENTGLTRFIFLSRIQEEKGVSIISEACRILHREGWGEKFNVSYFGYIEPSFADKFREQMGPNEQYEGFLNLMDDPVQGYRQMASFHAMLFPTFWKGEGFPGAIIDAFVAGLPVIATDWNMNLELVEHESNGLVIKPHEAIALADAMKKMIGDGKLRHQMALTCKKSATTYHISKIGPELIKYLH